jgi:ferredoxin-NADP reductase
LDQLVSPPAPSSVLAFVTTVHIVLVVVRLHRRPSTRPFGVAAVASLLFVGSPWLLTSAAGLGLGLVVHLAWFVAGGHMRAVRDRHRRTALAVPEPPLAIAQRARRRREFVHTRILSLVDETSDIRTFRMARPDGFEFEAGQFLTLRIHADGREHVRCYSISSSPDARNYLDISVKRLGLVSRTLHETLGPGSMMSVKAPAGTFVYPAGEDRPIVLIAGGIGITPLMSVLRHAVFTEPTRPVTLFYSVRTEGDVAFREEIHNLARCDPQLRLAVAITAGTTSTDSSRVASTGLSSARPFPRSPAPCASSAVRNR